MRAETVTAAVAQADLAAAAPAGEPAVVSSVMVDRASDYFVKTIEKNKKARPCPTAAVAAVSSMGTASAGGGARSALAFGGGGATGMGYVGGAVPMPSPPSSSGSQAHAASSARYVSAAAAPSAPQLFSLSTKESSARGAAGTHSSPIEFISVLVIHSLRAPHSPMQESLVHIILCARLSCMCAASFVALDSQNHISDRIIMPRIRRGVRRDRIEPIGNGAKWRTGGRASRGLAAYFTNI